MNKYFGTDGFRGAAGVDLTALHAFKTGRYLGGFLKNSGGKAKRSRVLIGKDTRLSSYMLEYAIAAGVAASGVDVYLLHVTTTPSVTYVTVSDSFDFGIMITASHNPYYDNGIKIIDASGEKIDDSLAAEIERYIDDDVPYIAFAKAADVGRIVDYSVGRDRYVEHLLSMAKHRYSGIRIGLDTANGAAANLAREVFLRLGATVYQIGGEPNGMNVNDGLGSTHPESLARLVKENHLDVGFAFDGDADRCIAIDEGGNVTDGDKIIYLLAKRLLRKGKLNGNRVVTTVMSNGGLLRSLEKLGICSEVTKVGDRFVYERMIETNSVLGGEQSGHIILSDCATTGDGILTAIAVMEEMSETGSTLEELTSDVIIYPQISRSIRVKNKALAIEDTALSALVSKIKSELSDRGRILVRASGTEPSIRIMVEAVSADLCQKYTDDIFELLARRGHLDE